MILFFHKKFSESAPEYLCSQFTRLDQTVYVSAITEPDDVLRDLAELELRCSVGNVIVCRQTWPVQEEHLYTMWFDLDRLIGVQNMKAVPLRSEVLLDGATVLVKEGRWAIDLTYCELGNKIGGFLNGGYTGHR
ncbi:MAG TPA: hypothetical protein VD973_23820 [Symbiobacteriaceae bacterium]|nr:hypothetical protein [Symbiobacteriaceae bacterium]